MNKNDKALLSTMGYISPREYLKGRLNSRWRDRVDPGPADYPRVEADYDRGIRSLQVIR